MQTPLIYSLIHSSLARRVRNVALRMQFGMLLRGLWWMAAMQEELQEFEAERLKLNEAREPVALAIGELESRIEVCRAVLALRAQRSQQDDARAVRLKVRAQPQARRRCRTALHVLPAIVSAPLPVDKESGNFWIFGCHEEVHR